MKATQIKNSSAYDAAIRTKVNMIRRHRRLRTAR
jgi:hypothetical protein